MSDDVTPTPEHACTRTTRSEEAATVKKIKNSFGEMHGK